MIQFHYNHREVSGEDCDNNDESDVEQVLDEGAKVSGMIEN